LTEEKEVTSADRGKMTYPRGTLALESRLAAFAASADPKFTRCTSIACLAFSITTAKSFR
jgi:hypothetical protein